MDKKILEYMIGGLLYMPAFQKNIVEKIKNNSFKCLTSVAFCLEDSVKDEFLSEAEETLRYILQDLIFIKKKLPLIFIRVRSPEHLQTINDKFSEFKSIFQGYILPKFDLNNAENYSTVIYEINRRQVKPFYIMPILETESVADLATRTETLIQIKKILDNVKSYVLNVRVGVNDFGNIYALRRDIDHTIYDIGVVRDILIDILNVFAKDYVVAASVWNYFGSEKNKLWSEGLQKELTLDRINGFIGKSAIHPSQLPYIFESLKTTRADLYDAEQILNWSSSSLGVIKGSGRMNELKCHFKWAERIKILSEIYGVRDDESLV